VLGRAINASENSKPHAKSLQVTSLSAVYGAEVLRDRQCPAGWALAMSILQGLAGSWSTKRLTANFNNTYIAQLYTRDHFLNDNYHNRSLSLTIVHDLKLLMSLQRNEERMSRLNSIIGWVSELARHRPATGVDRSDPRACD
jgi:hypothetical protein